MLMTEYQWEQNKKERLAIIEHEMHGVTFAELDEKDFIVEHENALWPEWHKLSVQRIKDGWELAPYGQSGSMFFMSGYFRKVKV